MPVFGVFCCKAAKRGPCQMYRRNTFHQRRLRRILRIRWQHNIINEEVLRHTGITTMHTTLSQRSLCWLFHALKISDEHIPMDLLYDELVVGKRRLARLEESILMSKKSLLTTATTGALISARYCVKWKRFFEDTEKEDEGTRTFYLLILLFYLFVFTVCYLCFVLLSAHIKSFGKPHIN